MDSRFLFLPQLSCYYRPQWWLLLVSRSNGPSTTKATAFRSSEWSKICLSRHDQILPMPFPSTNESTWPATQKWYMVGALPVPYTSLLHYDIIIQCIRYWLWSIISVMLTVASHIVHRQPSSLPFPPLYSRAHIAVSAPSALQSVSDSSQACHLLRPNVVSLDGHEAGNYSNVPPVWSLADVEVANSAVSQFRNWQKNHSRKDSRLQYGKPYCQTKRFRFPTPTTVKCRKDIATHNDILQFELSHKLSVIRWINKPPTQ